MDSLKRRENDAGLKKGREILAAQAAAKAALEAGTAASENKNSMDEIDEADRRKLARLDAVLATRENAT